MTTPSTHSSAHGPDSALLVLQRANRKMVGGLQDIQHELSLIKALRGESVTAIGRYQVYTDASEAGRTTVFVHEPTGIVEHKYILAKTESQSFVVATPMSWTPLHRNILARVIAATGQPVQCHGGGYVRILDNGMLEVEGESTDYGAADHASAQAALTVAVKKSIAT